MPFITTVEEGRLGRKEGRPNFLLIYGWICPLHLLSVKLETITWLLLTLSSFCYCYCCCCCYCFSSTRDDVNTQEEERDKSNLSQFACDSIMTLVMILINPIFPFLLPVLRLSTITSRLQIQNTSFYLALTGNSIVLILILSRTDSKCGEAQQH